MPPLRLSISYILEFHTCMHIMRKYNHNYIVRTGWIMIITCIIPRWNGFVSLYTQDDMNQFQYVINNLLRFVKMIKCKWYAILSILSLMTGKASTSEYHLNAKYFLKHQIVAPPPTLSDMYSSRALRSIS